MATIESYETKSGRRYMVRYRTPDRRPTKKRGFKTKRDAQDWAADNTVKMNTGTWRPAAAGRITVNDAAQAWLTAKSATVAPKTLTAYEQAVDRIKNIGTIGRVRLVDVDHEVVEQWVIDMSQHTRRKTHVPEDDPQHLLRPVRRDETSDPRQAHTGQPL